MPSQISLININIANFNSGYNAGYSVTTSGPVGYVKLNYLPCSTY